MKDPFTDLYSVNVTPEQIAVGRSAAKGDCFIGAMIPATALERINARWASQWGDIACAAVACRLGALESAYEDGWFYGVELTEDSLWIATAEAPFKMRKDFAFRFDKLRFFTIAHKFDSSPLRPDF